MPTNDQPTTPGTPAVAGEVARVEVSPVAMVVEPCVIEGVNTDALVAAPVLPVKRDPRLNLIPFKPGNKAASTANREPRIQRSLRLRLLGMARKGLWDETIAELIRLMRQSKSEKVKLQAIEMLAGYMMGKPSQPIEIPDDARITLQVDVFR